MVHARDERGMLTAEAEQLDSEINRQYDQGTDTLYPHDHHFLTRKSRQNTLNLPANEKRLWVAAIMEARRLCIDNRDQEQETMQRFMQTWLGNA